MFSFFNFIIIYLDNNSEKYLHVFNVIKGPLTIPSSYMTDNLLITEFMQTFNRYIYVSNHRVLFDRTIVFWEEQVLIVCL